MAVIAQNVFNFIKKLLEGWPKYLKLRYAAATMKIWLLLRQDVTKQLQQQKFLYESVLKHNSSKLIFDVGANEGFLSQLFLEMGYSVVALEPSPRNVAILKARFAKQMEIHLVNKAVSSIKGEKVFFESTKEHAFGTLSAKWKDIRDKQNKKVANYKKLGIVVSTVTLDNIIDEFGHPSFIKIDVEGHEEEVIKGLSRKVPLLSFEAILPHFLNETINCVQYLLSIAPTATFNYSVNSKLKSTNFVEWSQLQNEVCNIQGKTIEIFCKM